jgi:DnaJ-domain-containing protein 1
MKEHHPDRVAGLGEAEQAQAEERSKAINRAYAQLLGKA